MVWLRALRELDVKWKGDVRSAGGKRRIERARNAIKYEEKHGGSAEGKGRENGTGYTIKGWISNNLSITVKTLVQSVRT